MPAAKKPTETSEEPTQAEEPVQADPSPPEASKVCAICGTSATRMSSSTAYSPAYYCDEHGGAEPLKAIGG